MNVVVVSDNLQVGGAHVYAVQLANSLSARGVDVTLAYGVHAENPLAERLTADVRHLPLDLRPTLSMASKVNHVTNTFRAARTIAGELRTRPGSVVHTLFAASGLPAWIAAARAGAPVVATPMAMSVATNPLTKLLYRTRGLERLVTQHVTLSDYSRRDIVKAFGVAAERTETVRLGVDTDRYRLLDATLAERTQRLLGMEEPGVRIWAGVVARLDAAKCVDLAVRAVSASDPGVHLAIVGDGPERGSLQSLASDLGVSDRIHFLGRHLDVRPFVQAFDVYLQTTRGPNLGLSALEALASGVPLLIAARDADEREMADDTVLGRGGTVAEATPMALAAALNRLANASEDTRQHARHDARLLATECYDWEVHVDGIIRTYGCLARR